MSRSISEITEEALRLPSNEQFQLARTLLENAQLSGEASAEGAWDEEIERRIAAIDAGRARGLPFAEVLRTLDRRLGRA